MTNLQACPICGFIHRNVPVPAGFEALCRRCGAALVSPARRDLLLSRAFFLAVTALVLFFPGTVMPILKIERFGHAHETGILGGTLTLLQDGHLFLGVLLLVCSLIIPLLKLFGLLWLSGHSLQEPSIHDAPPTGKATRAFLVRFLESAGRWGMLDVLLLAILVAAVKLGDLIEVTPGPGALVFSLSVFCSLLASSQFSTHLIWAALPSTTEEAVPSDPGEHHQ